MIISIPRLFFLILFICASVAIRVQGQVTLSTKNKRAIELYAEADNYRVRGQYPQSIKLLEEAIERDKKFEEAYYRLAQIYRVQGNFQKAVQNFETGMSVLSNETKRKIYLYELTQTLLRQGKYAGAQAYANKFLDVEKADQKRIAQVKLWREQTEYALAHEKEMFDYKITLLSDTVNKFAMQYFPVITADHQQLIFTARFGGRGNDNEDIMVSHKDNGSAWSFPESISENINTLRREGTCTISADGRHLIFTICGERGCDLYESRKTGNNWSVPKSMGAVINSNAWESQPSLSADGRELYFVSDRKGGQGGYDIWYSQLEDTGWKKAENLGASVNTPFDEISPYIHVNNQTLYVVSNGYAGFGGYDIYVTERMQSVWSVPLNMGQPLNDFQDQYSFSVNNTGNIAYYSKEETRDISKLYQIELPQNKVVRNKGNVLKGKVTDVKNNKPVQARVELFDLKLNKRISMTDSDSVTGNYLIVLPGGAEYALYVSRPQYLFYSLHFNYNQSQADAPVVKNIALVPVEKNARVILNNLFFDVDKYELKEESITELNEIVNFLKTNPSIKIEISGHTDNSGSEEHNQQLSLKRASAVAAHLISNGIEKPRILEKGFGSTKPVSTNTTPQGRQENRRIEFKVL